MHPLCTRHICFGVRADDSAVIHRINPAKKTNPQSIHFKLQIQSNDESHETYKAIVLLIYTLAALTKCIQLHTSQLELPTSCSHLHIVATIMDTSLKT